MERRVDDDVDELILLGGGANWPEGNSEWESYLEAAAGYVVDAMVVAE